MASKWKGGRDVPVSAGTRSHAERPQSHTERRESHSERSDRRSFQAPRSETGRGRSADRETHQRPPTPSPPRKSSATSYAGVSRSNDDSSRSSPQNNDSIPVFEPILPTQIGRDYHFGNEFIHGRYHFDRWLETYQNPLDCLYNEMIERFNSSKVTDSIVIPYDDFVYFVYLHSSGYITKYAE